MSSRENPSWHHVPNLAELVRPLPAKVTTTSTPNLMNFEDLRAIQIRERFLRHDQLRSIHLSFDQVFERVAPTLEKKEELGARHGQLWDYLKQTTGMSPGQLWDEQDILSQEEGSARKKPKMGGLQEGDDALSGPLESEKFTLITDQGPDSEPIELPELSSKGANAKSGKGKNKLKLTKTQRQEQRKEYARLAAARYAQNTTPSQADSPRRSRRREQAEYSKSPRTREPVKPKKARVQHTPKYEYLSFKPGERNFVINHYPEVRRRISKTKNGPKLRNYLRQRDLLEGGELDTESLILRCHKEQMKDSVWPKAEKIQIKDGTFISPVTLGRNLRLCQKQQWRSAGKID